MCDCVQHSVKTEACLCVPGSLSPGFYVFATFIATVCKFIATFVAIFFASFFWQPLATFFLQQKVAKKWQKVAFVVVGKTVANAHFLPQKLKKNSCIKVATKLQKVA